MRLKSYLSYSQYSTYLASPRQYQKIYLDGVRLDNKYLDFGKMIADVLENREKEKNENERIACELLEKPEQSELELLVDFYKIPLFGKLDGFNKSKNEIVEYKTGKIEWTQKKVDEHEQLTFYAIMINKKFKIKFEDIKIKLVWLETMEDTDGTMFLTGSKKEFETKRSQKDILKIYSKIKKAWIGIGKLTNDYIKNI